jgi:ABC-2 type transport system ATP-binding protein
MILETNELSKRYGSIIAADGISLNVEEGTAFGLLGPNGSGKTTTLGMVLSVLSPETGSFRWFDSDHDYTAYKNIGSLLEVPNFFPYLSLKRNLEIIARIREVNTNDIDRVLDETGLLKRKGSRFDTLSLGMKQRMGLAAALLGNPRVLVLDEPANGLDPEGIAEVRNLILQQRENRKTIIMASHILDEVEKVCTHVGILKKGKMIVSGNVGDLLTMDDVIIASVDKPEEFKADIEKTDLVKTVTLSGNSLEIIPGEGKEASDINSFAFSKGYVLTELKIRKSSLEEQFLEIVKKK